MPSPFESIRPNRQTSYDNVYVIERPRAVPAIEVDCPRSDCQAGPDERCQEDRKPMRRFHAERQDNARLLSA